MRDGHDGERESGTPRMAFNPLAVELPTKLDFRKPEDWTRWHRRWERYRLISGLTGQDETTQINTLLYAMGEEAEDVLTALKLTDEQTSSYAAVVSAFEKHFLPRKNVIYERARFNSRKQEPHENVDTFATELFKMAERCDYRTLKDELIRDRLVVGLRDVKLSERLQLDSELTLEKALTAARNSESVKQQHKEIRSIGQSTLDVGELHGQANSKNRRNETKAPSRSRPQRMGKKGDERCKWCGNVRDHTKVQCPAANKTCNHCGKKGHYACVCLSKPKDDFPSSRERPKGLEELYLGEVTVEANTPWRITATLNKSPFTFKVDTGADVTAIAHDQYDSNVMGPIKPTQQLLIGPGQTTIATVGYVDATVAWRNTEIQETVFIIKGLKEALLSRPAIEALGILQRPLELAETRAQATDVPDFLASYPKLTSGLGFMKTEYRIKVRNDAKPYAVTYPRRVPLPLLPLVKKELKRMEDMRVVQKIEHATEWCFPMVVARKKNDELRICVDYGQLNQQILRERVLMPTVDECLAKLAGATVFSRLDTRAGYWQVPLAKDSREYTTFITPVGRFQFLRLPFGISTAPEFCQREMLRILEGLDGVSCLQDDIIISGKTTEEHDTNLRLVLKKLEDAGVTLNTDKCSFRQTQVIFLGHVVSATGISADPGKVRAITQLDPPRDESEVRSLLGSANHLAKFLPDLADFTKPLRDLLHQDAEWHWGPVQQQSFDKLKQALSRTPILTHYDAQQPHTVSVDASSYGLGAVLLQQSQQRLLPVAYASRSLTETEQRYAQIEKEALAITWACEHFRKYLLGSTFHVETDHKPLVPLLTTKRLDELSPRLQRFRMRLLEYDYTMSHTPGNKLYTADLLSRKPLKEPANEDERKREAAVHEFEELVLEQLPASNHLLNRIRTSIQTDKTLSKIATFCTTSWPTVHGLSPDLKRYVEVASEISLVDGLLFKGDRIIIPPDMRVEVLEKLHAGHLGTTRCRARARESVWWPSIGKHIEDFVDRCPTCQEHRKPGTEPLLLTPLPAHPWETVGIDLFTLEGKEYVVVVDYYSRFIELEQLKRTTTKDIAQVLEPIFARFGVPTTLRTDNGPQFTSAEFKELVQRWGATHTTSSPYYAQSNGMAERAVQTAKQLLRKTSNINEALLAYRASPGVEGFSPGELLMGRRLNTTIPTTPRMLAPKWDDSEFRKKNEAYRVQVKATYDTRHKAQSRGRLSPGTAVRIFTGAASHGVVTVSAATKGLHCAN
ncbi:uncharacterized protein K02A2.6-like [Rhipicephalus sanguineus]|uniref:uncharacterized protein K02A2.6-like n=1 Tax=Rhipicephalus sanguineus TaxID=34632 RepID=UPI001894EAB4|nr:uncharacterized protein K02A2.6-like [Rhipicephalus sanguineus]